MSFDFVENITLYMPEIENDLNTVIESDVSDKKKLIIELAAIHEGLTANYNNYRADELEKSLATWVQPYPKPIITNHDQTSESLGRVMAAKMDKEADGSSYIRLQVAVTGTENIEKCLDERYLTGSVGGRAESAKCSICNVEWSNASMFSLPCKHQRGKVYNGKLAYMELSDISWKEYSFVNVPADQKSGFRKVSIDTSGTKDSDESWVRSVSFYSIDMNKESIIEFVESESPRELLSEMKKKDAHVMYMNVKGTFLSASSFDYNEKINNDEDEKSKFDKTHTTISDELRLKTHNHTSAEENENMGQKLIEDSEDILSVTEKLSADLNSNNDEQSSTDEDETTTEEEVVDESTEEIEVTNDDEAAEESSDDTDAETDTVAESTEDTEETSETHQEEQLGGNEDVDSADELVEDEGESDVQLEGESTDEVDDLAAQIEALKTENAKLKKSLHFMLAERVVDIKIAVGLIESSSRATELTEHATRTAASLADALRDLEKMPVITRGGLAPRMEERVMNSDSDNSNVVTLEESGNEAFTKNPASQWEDRLVDVMMNRKKL